MKTEKLYRRMALRRYEEQRMRKLRLIYSTLAAASITLIIGILAGL